MPGGICQIHGAPRGSCFEAWTIPRLAISFDALERMHSHDSIMNKHTRSLILSLSTSVLFLSPSVTLHAQNDVTMFSVGKGQIYTQNSAGHPVLKSVNPFLFEAAVADNEAAVFSATVRTPDGGSRTLDYDFSGSGLIFQATFPSQQSLDQNFGPGGYLFDIETANQGTLEAVLNLGAVAYPAAPRISNFAAAQALNPISLFTLTWDPIPGATAQDFIRVRVIGNFGDVNFDSGAPLQPGALNGTATSVLLNPSEFSDDTVTATVQYMKVLDRQTAAIPGATGLVLASATTELPLKISGGSTGDMIPPVLTSSVPQNGAVGVHVNTLVSFTFSEAMSPQQSILWSSNVASNQFQYAWSANGRTLTATYSENFPSNAIITWQLNPPTSPLFTDLAGNPLLPGIFSGQFTTSSSQGTNVPPCDPDSDEEGGGFSISKAANYVQTSAAPPVLDTNTAAMFSAFVGSPTNNLVTQASLTLPNGAIQPMTNFFGDDFFLMGDNVFPTIEALQTAYPPGNYTLSIQRQDNSTRAVALSFPADPFPPTPQILNFPQAQAVDPNTDFTLQWNPFTGAQGHDSIYLYIYDEDATGPGVVFQAPDRCVPRDLPVTATSIVIPRGIFAPGRRYLTTLSFYRILVVDTNTISDLPGQASSGKSTSFTLLTTGGGPTPTPPRFEPVVRQGQNLLLRLVGQPSTNYLIESTSALNQAWTPYLTTNSPTGTIELTVPKELANSSQFFRARIAP